MENPEDIFEFEIPSRPEPATDRLVIASFEAISGFCDNHGTMATWITLLLLLGLMAFDGMKPNFFIAVGMAIVIASFSIWVRISERREGTERAQVPAMKT